eukprot:4750105-Pleurochrysis_carterae.AAC.1
MRGVAGARTPFWLGSIVADERVDVGECPECPALIASQHKTHALLFYERGVRRTPANLDDKFKVHWYGVFETIKKGTHVTQRLTNS